MVPPGCPGQAGNQEHSIKITSSPLSTPSVPSPHSAHSVRGVTHPQTRLLRPGPSFLLLTVPPVLEPSHFHMHRFHSFQLFFIQRALNQEQAVSTPVDI